MRSENGLIKFEFVKYLKKEAVDKDRRLFLDYSKGYLTTSETIKYFKWNNDIPEDFEISECEFVAWLKSIGYCKEVGYV